MRQKFDSGGGFLAKVWASWKQDYLAGIKSLETEDWVDLVFYRPVGLVLAKGARLLGLSPNFLTILGMALGVGAAVALFGSDHGGAFFLGAAALLLSGALDSADGQLARLTNSSSQLGLVLDGLCDNVVFGALYLAGASTLTARYGAGAWVLAVAAGMSHSFQSACLDFYLREYLFFGGRGAEGYWNPTLKELKAGLGAARGIERLFLILRLSWVGQQQALCGPRKEWRIRWKKWAADHNGEFSVLYRHFHYFPLYGFRPLGTNLHTFLLLLFAYWGRFDGYLIFVDLLAMNGLLLLARRAQLAVDRRFEMAAQAGF